MTLQKVKDNFPKKRGKPVPDPRCPMSYRLEIDNCGYLGKCNVKTIDQCPWKKDFEKYDRPNAVADPPFWREDI